MRKYFLIYLYLGICLVSCNTDDDANDDVNVEEIETKLVSDYPVQDFMWEAMNLYYFWQADVTDLDDSKDDLEAEYAEFLSTYEDPADFFYNICYLHENVVGEDNAIDRFSFHSEDYQDLVQGFSGISKSNGVEFGLSLYGDGEDVFGFVRYIVPGSNADGKDIERGEVFIGVNGTNLNLSNYQELLFGDLDTYTLNFADIIDNTITPNDKELSLTKEEGLVENPILTYKIIEQGSTKIGYLLYNSFVADFDEELNTVFGEFQGAGVNEVILDFRYNGGGRVSSALQIASAVYGTNTSDLFLKARYNDKIMSTFDAGDGETNFTATTINGTAINTLNLSRVFVITSGSTASASELVINGLEPYVDVQQIGTVTVGKNEFSITFVDDRTNNFFYDADSEENINPDNQWAIQPLLGRNENADGFSDYTLGLNPDVELREDVTNMGVLGDESEPLLALTLSTISGITAKNISVPLLPVSLVSSSAMDKVTNHKMVMDGLPNLGIRNLGEQ